MRPLLSVTLSDLEVEGHFKSNCKFTRKCSKYQNMPATEFKIMRYYFTCYN